MHVEWRHAHVNSDQIVRLRRLVYFEDARASAAKGRSNSTTAARVSAQFTRPDHCTERAWELQRLPVTDLPSVYIESREFLY